MKRILTLIIAVSMLLCSCCPEPVEAENSDANNAPKEIKGVWIFYKELSMESEKGGDAISFRQKIETVFDNCLKAGINTVFVHVRAFADSFYPSKIFPWSKYLTSEQGSGVDYDPLEIMIAQAHKRGLSFHAWINPFRVQLNSSDEKLLSENNPAKKLIKNKSNAVSKASNGIYFNPANVSAQKLILDGIREIVANYDVDGIHIDDYFYPSTEKSIDKNDYQIYLKNGGTLTLEQWRRECVSSFVSGMYTSVKAIKKDVIVSISPAGNIDNNINTLFADVKKWCSDFGYCDWIIPQIYFGFNNKTIPFKKAVDNWVEITDLSKVKLIAGLAVYKAVQAKGEWSDKNILHNQIEYLKSTNAFGGFCCFSYSSIIQGDYCSMLNDFTVTS